MQQASPASANRSNGCQERSKLAFLPTRTGRSSPAFAARRKRMRACNNERGPRVKGEAVASSGPGAVATVPEVAGCATPGLVELGVYCVRPLKWPQDGSRPQENTPNATRTEGTGGTSRIPKKQRRELPHGSRERGRVDDGVRISRGWWKRRARRSVCEMGPSVLSMNHRGQGCGLRENR